MPLEHFSRSCKPLQHASRAAKIAARGSFFNWLLVVPIYRHRVNMPPTFVIKLPKEVVPAFPRRCVVCLTETTSTLDVGHNAGVSAYSGRSLYTQIFGDGRLQVPLCSACRPRFLLRRFFWSWWWVLLAGLAYFGVTEIAYGGRLTAEERGYVVLTIGVLFTSTTILLDITVAKHFQSNTVSGEHVYSFSNSDYATMFRDMNKAGRP